MSTLSDYNSGSVDMHFKVLPFPHIIPFSANYCIFIVYFLPHWTPSSFDYDEPIVTHSIKIFLILCINLQFILCYCCPNNSRQSAPQPIHRAKSSHSGDWWQTYSLLKINDHGTQTAKKKGIPKSGVGHLQWSQGINRSWVNSQPQQIIHQASPWAVIFLSL